MVRKRRFFRKKTIVLILLFCLFVAFHILIQVATRSAQLGIYKGVLVSLQYGVCLLMMFADLKRGSKLAVTLMSLSAATMAIAIFRGATEALPGICNAVFYIITIIVIAHYDIRIETESRTDLITGVNNRKGLYIELEEKIARGLNFNIIYISIDNFKAINDSYGHAYGDELLCKMSRRIEKNFGKECIISRIGGAEFVIAIDDKNDAQATADRLLEIIKEKAVLDVEDNKIECYAECFAGVSNYPNDAQDYESLIKYADIAMTEASAGKSKQAYLFDAQMQDTIDRQIYVKKLIKEGLANDEFYLMYQPQFELNDKKLRGFEALLRLKTNDGENISPAEFIPVAERSDLILQIDDYVLSRVMKEFREVVVSNPKLIVSVNVSAKNFADIDFVEKIKRIIADREFPAENLEIEITEYCMVNSIDATRENIEALRNIGVKIALDDFGTGYTSLNYVASLPIDLLKIDKSLVDDIESDGKRRDFVRTVISMGQLMDCEIISEGVEKPEQIECLREDGCDLIQGFVWSRPLMYEDAIELVAK